MRKGKIDVTSENIFPIIKKFLYSDHEIFLRELVSNAIDATQKLKALSVSGDFKGELGDSTVRVAVDKEAKTITVSDHGIGMTADEIEKYINQIAFSSAGDFLEKYKDKIDAIIGHFGLGFYSSFIVSERVEILTKSYKDDAQAVKWTCSGSPEFEITEAERDDFGTDVILHIDSESTEFLEDSRIEELLKKYCKFLPLPIAFGKEKEWKDGQQIETDKDRIINNTEPAWIRKPADLEEEDYKNFYRELYPGVFEEPLFHIHLNVDYPFNLTGILYFPKLHNSLEVNKNKIQLYSNQVFVTDSVEGIVPEFLTLLHGVLDSPDIPLNVSRSYLQSDSNVKKISGHINKKVADQLQEIFKNDRKEFEKKWNDLKLFMQYGMVTNEKFYDRVKDSALYKNTDGKFFTWEEYQNLIKTNQTDKHNKLILLYANNLDEQYTFIEAAKNKGYDVLLFDGTLDTHYMNHLEQKNSDIKFTRVDAEVVDKLIEKDDMPESSLSKEQQDDLSAVFESQLPKDYNFSVLFEDLSDSETPAIITQSEFMRRMKDMAKLGGQSMGFYGDLPDSFNLVINSKHELVNKVVEDKDKTVGEDITKLREEMKPIEEERENLQKAQEDKKEEEIPQTDKDKITEIDDKLRELDDKRDKMLTDYGQNNQLVKQIIDLALLSNGMLKGKALTDFIKRSVTLIK